MNFDEFGDVLNFRGMIYEPINEQGVVALFSMIAQDLGFQIEGIREDFPDCSALYQ